MNNLNVTSKQELRYNCGMYRIETEKGSLLVSPEHKVYFSSDISNLSSYRVINLPSKSSDFVFSSSSLENSLNKDSSLSCGILNQMIENILLLEYKNLSVKSQSLVINILSSDTENLASSPFESFLGLKITSKSFLRNCNNSFLTFSSSRNLSFLSFDANDDIVPSLNETSCIMQSCFNVLFCEGHQKIIKDFFNRYSCFEQFQNLPNHNSSTFECWLSVADFTVCNNVIINFSSHEANNTSDYLNFLVGLISGKNAESQSDSLNNEVINSDSQDKVNDDKSNDVKDDSLGDVTDNKIKRLLNEKQ